MVIHDYSGAYALNKRTPSSIYAAGGAVYPEIVRIIYYPEKQQQKLITRDLRFAEMTL